jgi:hypothetical protein
MRDPWNVWQSSEMFGSQESHAWHAQRSAGSGLQQPYLSAWHAESSWPGVLCVHGFEAATSCCFTCSLTVLLVGEVVRVTAVPCLRHHVGLPHWMPHALFVKTCVMTHMSDSVGHSVLAGLFYQ